MVYIFFTEIKETVLTQYEKEIENSRRGNRKLKTGKWKLETENRRLENEK